jgi:cytidylate kinase-like protein
MPRRVVCISGSAEAGRDRVGRLVADQLQLRYVDEDIIAAAAGKAHVDPGLLADVEQRKPLIRRILDELAESGTGGLAVGGFPPPGLGESTPTSEHLRALIREAIEEIAARGSVVIVAHAASFALAGREDILRVLITASPETRAGRLAAARTLGDAEAAREVKAADAARADYLNRFHGVGRELPTHYDLVVNTDVLSAEQAGALVVQAATS